MKEAHEEVEVLTVDPTHSVFIAFKGGATIGPMPALYNQPSGGGAIVLVNDFARYIENGTQTTENYHLNHSIVSVNFAEVASIHLQSGYPPKT
ncbi:MAG: hypothetical protein ACE37K_20190 [Planctomycetota bacterium]|jgi:hypothetical protein